MKNSNNPFWEKFKARIKGRWQQLSDEDLEYCRNDFQVLSEQIQMRCEESRDTVQNYIDNLWFEIYVRGAKDIYKASFLNYPKNAG